MYLSLTVLSICYIFEIIFKTLFNIIFLPMLEMKQLRSGEMKNLLNLYVQLIIHIDLINDDAIFHNGKHRTFNCDVYHSSPVAQTWSNPGIICHFPFTWFVRTIWLCLWWSPPPVFWLDWEVMVSLRFPPCLWLLGLPHMY